MRGRIRSSSLPGRGLAGHAVAVEEPDPCGSRWLRDGAAGRGWQSPPSNSPESSPASPVRETQGRREIVRSTIAVKCWLLEMPSVAAVRPACCPVCEAASTPIGSRIVLQGHGKRPRQGWGPAAPRAPPKIQALMVRRYRCIMCGALTTVGPSETLTKRLYTAPAIAWALALFGLLLMTRRPSGGS
jgi:hypothetical protein